MTLPLSRLFCQVECHSLEIMTRLARIQNRNRLQGRKIMAGPGEAGLAEPGSLKHPLLLHDLLKHNKCS